MSWLSEGNLDSPEQSMVRDSGIWDKLCEPVQQKVGEGIHYLRVNKVRKVRGGDGEYLEVGIRVYYEALWEQYKVTDTPAGRFYLRLDHENAWGMPEGEETGESYRSLLGALALLHERDQDMTPSHDAPLLTSPPMLTVELAEAALSPEADVPPTGIIMGDPAVAELAA